MSAKTIQTTCAYCGVGCGITAKVLDPDLHLVEISGREDHPANYGRLCSKGSALGETVSLEGRLLEPKISGQSVSWNQALSEVADRLRHTINQFGPESVALYGSGQLLTEDYYVANKLMKGFIGSANIDTNSRLCMASTVAGQKRAFGSDTVPNNYEDLELADLLILTGSNTAWCHPVLFQRIRAMKSQRPDMKIVVIDPRITATCDIADLHLPVRPGTDVVLFEGLLNYLAESNALNHFYIDAHTDGFEQALKSSQVSSKSLSAVAETCRLDVEDVQAFYALFVTNEKTVTAWSQGVNQSVSGTDKVNAIINCHLATGRIGKPGSGPLSLTGQPNAMGGREVGGLANQLAAHMDFSCQEDIDRVRRFWCAPNMVQEGGKTAIDLFDAVEKGDIKFIWIMGTNPAVSMPNAGHVRKALRNCPTVVVSDCIEKTDTAELADILLPAAGWSEKDGTITNSERRISRQRSLFPYTGMAKPDWWIISQVAQQMGFSDAFNYRSPADVFREHAALSGFENNPSGKLRDFNIAPMADLSDSEYQQLEPFQWPLLKGEKTGGRRLFGQGGFYTPNQKARFIVTRFQEQENQTDQQYPFLLNTGRVRDHWHTMTRTGLSARLNQHTDEPVLEINPVDLKSHGLTESGLCRVVSSYGVAIVRVKSSENIAEKQIFLPMHWSLQNSKTGGIGQLVNPLADPYSRQPDLKHTPVRLERWNPKEYGVLLTRKQQSLDTFDYATEVRAENCFRYELAGSELTDINVEFNHRGLERIDYHDQMTGARRSGWFSNGLVYGLLIVGKSLQMSDRLWLQQAFVRDEIPFAEQWRLLAGIAPMGEDSGNLVCACFGIGEKSICRTIRSEGLSSVAQVGEKMKAGTNCGSCIPEISQLLESAINRAAEAV